MLLVTCLKSIASQLDDWIDVIDAMDLEQLAHTVTITLTRFLLDLHNMPAIPEPTTSTATIPGSNAKKGKKKRASMETLVENDVFADAPPHPSNGQSSTDGTNHTALHTQLINAENKTLSLTATVAQLQQQNSELQAATASKSYLEAILAAVKSELAVAYLEDGKKQKRIDKLTSQLTHPNTPGTSHATSVNTSHANAVPTPQSPLRPDVARLEQQLSSQQAHSQSLALKVTDAEGRAAVLTSRTAALERELVSAQRQAKDAQESGYQNVFISLILN